MKSLVSHARALTAFIDFHQHFGEVLRATNGTLFGTTSYGGTGGDGCGESGCGAVWSYVP